MKHYASINSARSLKNALVENRGEDFQGGVGRNYRMGDIHLKIITEIIINDSVFKVRTGKWLEQKAFIKFCNTI